MGQESSVQEPAPVAPVEIRPDAPPPPGPSSRSTLSRIRMVALVALPLAMVTVAWGTPLYVYSRMQQEKDQPQATDVVEVVSEPHGERLFVQHCAYCHGVKGDGNGIAHLEPRSRHFGNEKYKLGTTSNWWSPSDDDLIRTIRRGIPGTAMPSFSYLPEADIRAMIDYVRRLTRSGVYANMWKKAQKEYDAGDGDTPDPAKISPVVAKMCAVGTPLTVPAFPTPTPQSLAHGKEVFLKSCANCHGPEGRGDGQQVKDPNFKNENGTPAKPRDLTRGVFKGGRESEYLYARIMLGIPGTPMPASKDTMPPQDAVDLVNYVRSLCPVPLDAGLAGGVVVAGDGK